MNWLSDRERTAWRNLSLMNLQLGAVLTRDLAGSDLSYQDYVVLAHLSDHDEGRVRMNELGANLGWEKSRVSHHVARMEGRGLVRRERCPSDRRGWFVAISPTGRSAIAAAAPGHVAAVRRHFIDLLSPAQIGHLDRIATTVLAHLATLPPAP